jgi:hypothetical protein
VGGVFDLDNPAALLAKLGRELDRLRDEPKSVDHAFNFFVTAEHMLDWVYPGDSNEPVRRHVRETNTLLQVASHLANGAKHFVVRRHHRSVTSTEKNGGFWATGYWPGGFFGRGYWPEPGLVVLLDGAAAQTLGHMVTALDLAEDVYRFWSAPGRLDAP